VKVLDFGIAKLPPHVNARDAEGANESTLTVAGTREGLIIGTAAYMSPEQARGQIIDKRTDVWAFGCVIYEMLTGRAAFTRQTTTDTLAALLESEPDWTALPDATPPGLKRLLRRCLVKDLRFRLRDIGDARLELADVGTAVDDDAITAPPGSTNAARRWPRIAAGVGLVALGAAGALLWTLSRPAIQPTTPALTRTTITLPSGQELDTRGGAHPLAIASDGRRIAYVADSGGRSQLYIRSMDAFEPKPIAGTEGAQYPFFSPDAEWVAFFGAGKLKRVAVRGGSPLTICDAPIVGHGAAWGPDGTIVFDPGNAGLLRVAAAGGTPEPLTTRDQSIDNGNISWPQFLPNGRGLLATVGTGGEVTLAVLSLETREWRRLGPGSQAQYLPSGHLLYHAVTVREGELQVLAFDAESMTIRGTPVAVLDTVFRAQNGGAAYFGVAQTGTLVFTPGGYARTLVRVNRDGRRTPITDDRRGFRHPEISPDGRRVAVTVDPRPSQVWVYDLARRSGIPLSTTDHSLGPVWSPDGRRVTYISEMDLFWRAADASGPAERLLAREGAQYPTSWSADGQLLLFDDSGGQTQVGSDIWVLPRKGPPRPLIATAHEERAGRLSPDGRWVAYHSDESGRLEVYVRPFPNVDDRKWTISTAGGRRPVWASSGRELFYAAGSSIIRVPVTVQGTTFSAGTPEALFSGPFDLATTDFSITPDGSHFIMVEGDPNARPTQVHVVVGWTEEVRQLAAPARQ